LIAVAVWSELGDCRRFSRSQQVVRHTGLDVTVDASDRHRAHGHLTRQDRRRCAERCSKQR
jgi:transposase